MSELLLSKDDKIERKSWLREKMATVFYGKFDEILVHRMMQKNAVDSILRSLNSMSEAVADGNMILQVEMKNKIGDLLENNVDVKECLDYMTARGKDMCYCQWVRDKDGFLLSKARRDEMQNILVENVFAEVVDYCNKKGLLHLSFDECVEKAFTKICEKDIEKDKDKGNDKVVVEEVKEDKVVKCNLVPKELKEKEKSSEEHVL